MPQCLHNQVLRSLHDDNGHQGLQCVMDLLCGSDLLANYVRADANHWLAQCEGCLVSKGDYNEPKTVQGSLVANQPLQLLCIDFTMANIVKGAKRTF